MTRLVLVATAASAVLGWTAPAIADALPDPAVDPSGFARAAMQMVEDRPDGRDSIARTEIEITDRFGETTLCRILRLRRDFGPDEEDAYTFSFIADPEEMAGTRVLTRDYGAADKEDEQFILIPGIDEVKRIAVDSYQSRLMGSDITYGDLSSRDLDLYDFTYEGEETVEQWRTHVISFKPRTQEEIDRYGYTSGKVWVDPETWLVVRSIFEMTQPGQSKLFMTKAVEQVDGYWSPSDMTFVTQQDGHVVSATTMRLFDQRYDVGLPETLFREDALRTTDRAELLPVRF